MTPFCRPQVGGSEGIALENPYFQKSREGGRSRGGRCANFTQVARQICDKLPVFLFVHQRKGAQNCRKFVANSKVNSGQFYANTPFPMPPSPNFWYFCVSIILNPPVATMAPNFTKLVSKFWKLVSKQRYALTSRNYSLTSRNYSLTSRKYSRTSGKYSLTSRE